MRSDYQILLASEAAGYVGGGYYSPAEDVPAKGRLLQSLSLEGLLLQKNISMSDENEPTYVIEAMYNELVNLLIPGEILFGVYDSGDRRMAVQIPSVERLVDFECQLPSYRLTRVGFFGVVEAQANLGLVAT